MSTALNIAYEKYEPSHVFALFSGGHDSLCSTALTAKRRAVAGSLQSHRI